MNAAFSSSSSSSSSCFVLQWRRRHRLLRDNNTTQLLLLLLTTLLVFLPHTEQRHFIVAAANTASITSNNNNDANDQQTAFTNDMIDNATAIIPSTKNTTSTDSSSSSTILSSSSSTTTTTTTSAHLSQNNKCTIYLAPSTIPRAGLGIFTTIFRKRGETIGNGDVFLPLLEMDWHNRVRNQAASASATATATASQQQQADNSYKPDYFNPFSDYVWTGQSMGMGSEVASDDIAAMCPGLDAAINCNLALLNVGKALPIWDDGGLHRSRDPGAGALTPYHNGSMPIVNRDIPPGGELFKDYGQAWFETRPKWFYALPLRDDYLRAQNLLDAFGRLIGVERQKSDDATDTVSAVVAAAADTVAQDATTTSRNNNNNNNNKTRILFRFTVELQRDLWEIVANSPYASRTINALPKHVEDAWIGIQEGLTTGLYQPYAVRSQEYLEEFGKCFDNIRPGRSTIAQAGRGAFAVRPLQNGTIISGSPLLHLPHYQTFHMYERTNGSNSSSDTMSEKHSSKGAAIVGQQLMLNYCFGHIQSTLLLCPYGSGVTYINHNQTLANVRVQWSKNGLTSHNDTWLTLDPQQMDWIDRPHLALDYIALRDIQEGEELFMDYGVEFEKAWQHHVETWKPSSSSSSLHDDHNNHQNEAAAAHPSYASAHAFNLRMAQTPLRTEQEQEWDPYPHNLEIRCHSVLLSPDWKHYNNLNNKEAIPTWSLDDKGHPCRILHRVMEHGVDLYDVHMYEVRWGEHDAVTGTSPEHTRSRVPRHAIAFADRPYTTDIHLRNAFRFPIMIPDDIVPNAWRNAKPPPNNHTKT